MHNRALAPVLDKLVTRIRRRFEAVERRTQNERLNPSKTPIVNLSWTTVEADSRSVSRI